MLANDHLLVVVEAKHAPVKECLVKAMWKWEDFEQFDEAVLVMGGILFPRKFCDECKALNLSVCYQKRGGGGEGVDIIGALDNLLNAHLFMKKKLRLC